MVMDVLPGHNGRIGHPDHTHFIGQNPSGMANVDPLKPGLRLDVHNDQELGALAVSFNAMADRLEGERRASSARLLIAQEDDRRRIAAELHDEVGQQLTALLLTLDRLADHTDPDVGEQARAAREIVRGSLDQLRALVRGLRPPGLDELGLTAALTALSRQVGERAGLTVTRHLDPVPDDVDPAAALVVYRVAQECLTNADRHALVPASNLPCARQPIGLSCASATTGPAST